jgi:lysophospholipase L1-like esterase
MGRLLAKNSLHGNGNYMPKGFPNVAGSIPYGPQIITTRCNGCDQTFGPDVASGTNWFRNENRRQFFIGPSAVSRIQVAFGGYIDNSGGGDTVMGNGNNMSIQATLEIASPSVVFQDLYFNGQKFPVLPDGKAVLLSDPMEVDWQLAANSILWLRWAFIGADSSVTQPLKFGDVSAGVGDLTGELGILSNAGVSQISGTGALSTPTGGGKTNAAYPFAIIGVAATPMPAVYIYGDSIGNGAHDNYDSMSNRGYIQRGLAAAGAGGAPIPYRNSAVSTSTFANNTTIAQLPRSRSYWKYCTHFVCEMGSNDINNGVALATLQSQLTTLLTAVKNTIGPYGKPLKVAVCKITPRTNSSDNWQTIVNQSYVNAAYTPGGLRDQYNAWIVSQVGLGLIDTIIDPTLYVEDQANHGKWIVNGTSNYSTVDGVHPSPAAYILAAQAAANWAATITP